MKFTVSGSIKKAGLGQSGSYLLPGCPSPSNHPSPSHVHPREDNLRWVSQVSACFMGTGTDWLCSGLFFLRPFALQTGAEDRKAAPQSKRLAHSVPFMKVSGSVISGFSSATQPTVWAGRAWPSLHHPWRTSVGKLADTLASAIAVNNELSFLFFSFLFFFFLRFYLFIFRERRREGEREGEKHWRARETPVGCLSHVPKWGPGQQPRHVPWPGIKQVTFRSMGWCSTHWATPIRAQNNL